MAEEQEEAAGREDDAEALRQQRIQEVLLAINAADEHRLGRLLDEMHPADVADLMEQVGDRTRQLLLRFWGRDIGGEILSELDEGVRAEVIEALPDSVLSEAVLDLESDDIVDLVENLEDDRKDAVLDALPAADRVAVEQALNWPEYSAGRLMQREVVTAPEHWTVGQTIDHLRREDRHLPEQFYHVILVDPTMTPTGYVTLGKLLSSARATALKSITEHSFRTVPVEMYEGDVAYIFNQYHLISVPVVDKDDRLVGVITIDDAMAVLDEEHGEDMLRLAGVTEESSLSDSAIETTRLRLPWLAVNLCTAILASLVIALFEDVIAQVVALAVLMPIVASMGGNAGTQSLTVAVRAIATKDLTVSNLWRVVGRELLVGMLNGVVFAIVMGVVALAWFGSAQIGLVIALAMVVNLAVAALAGILVPVTMERLGVDPALASGTFVTTVTDVVGFFAFLGTASMVLL
ncbi:magnesium transporter [Tropicimonas isoalkanivorans]|uniref:Magnesium transporter MgtE n=1 Tax=Tropicimonas isoalkanivorans TaxID=441112 RepID=A0A1I1JGL5_9RHOB|nr:magnesium transporter [Tropicimonas isoalkanivorans]SFC47616.1 magnesium transporter [Tropicimonas isoalkanivorans]